MTTDKRSFQRFVRKLDKIGLRQALEERAIDLHVSLRDLYGDDSRGTTSISAARREIYLWLQKQGKGINEIARLFDRAPSGVLKMMRRHIRKGTVRKARGRAKRL